MIEVKLKKTDGDKNWVYFSINDHRGTIRDILQNVNLKNKFLFIINSFTFNIKGCPDTYVNIYPEIFEYQQYAVDNNLHFIVIFEMVNEAPSYNNELEYLINFVKEKCNLQYNQLLTLTGAHFSDTPLIKHVQVLSIIGNHVIFQNTSHDTLPKHHFISLARMAKSHRVAATVEILERNLDKFGYCSCGSGYYTNPQENDFSYLPPNLQSRFPIYIDGEIVGSMQQQYFITHSAMEFAFANIVMETSFDKDFSYFLFNNITWNLPFTTEKTMKAFAWGQVPIFITVKNNDVWLREVGFDLFDDIIDQNYNKEIEPHKRIKLAIDELEKICSKPINYWIDYKKSNLERFKQNRILADKIVAARNFISGDNLQKVLDTM